MAGEAEGETWRKTGLFLIPCCSGNMDEDHTIRTDGHQIRHYWASISGSLSRRMSHAILAQR